MNVTSTIQGLGTFGYVSTLSLQSTVLTFVLNPTLTNLASTVTGLGTANYVSSLSLQSTVANFTSNYINTTSLNSTIAGLGSANYVSTLSLQSTVNFIQTNYPANSNVTSTIQGLGTFGYVSTLSLASTVNFIQTNYLTNSNIGSTLRGLGTSGYISTLSLQSTVNSIQGNFVVSASNQSTVAGLGTAGYVSTASLGSTTAGIFGNMFFATSLTSTIVGLGSANYISTLSLQSTVVGLSGAAVPIPMSNLQSTVAGLGSAGYLSTQASGYVFISSLAGNFSSLILGGVVANATAPLDVRGTAKITNIQLSNLYIGPSTLGTWTSSNVAPTNMILGLSNGILINNTIFINNFNQVGINLSNSTGNLNANFIYNTTTSTSNTSNVASNFNMDTLLVNGVIRTTNDTPLKVTPGAWWGMSDSNVKTDIVQANLERCYDIIQNIPIYHYKYNSSFTENHPLYDGSRLGFIAQTVSSIFPKSLLNMDGSAYGLESLLSLDLTQIQMAHYGATKHMMNIFEQQGAQLQSNALTLQTLSGNISTLFGQLQSNTN